MPGRFSLEFLVLTFKPQLFGLSLLPVLEGCLSVYACQSAHCRDIIGLPHKFTKQPQEFLMHNREK